MKILEKFMQKSSHAFTLLIQKSSDAFTFFDAIDAFLMQLSGQTLQMNYKSTYFQNGNNCFQNGKSWKYSSK